MSLRTLLSRWRHHRGGNFAVTAGLTATVLVAAVGGGSDLARQFWARSAAQRAVDAAALGGAKQVTAGGLAAAEADIQTIAAANIPNALANMSFVDQIDQSAGTVKVTATGTLKPYFLQLLKVDSLSIGASATATIEQKQYADFYILLDTSESMNIAASEADRIKLEAITSAAGIGACAFACHEGNSPSVWQVNQDAGDNKARLRIDVARDALGKIIDKLLALNTAPDSLKSIRVATGVFSWNYRQASPPVTDPTALKASLATPNGVPSDESSNSHTNYPDVLAKFQKKLGLQGNGRSQKTAQKFALLVTDGVRDNDSGFDNSGLGPLDPGLCQSIKANGITLAVLEIKYIARFDAGNFFRDRVSWYYNQISPNVQQCASPGFYFLATDADQAEAKLIAATDALLAQQSRLIR